MTLPLDDPFYRPKVIAEKTGKNYDTITAAIRAGALKGVKLGKRSIGVRASEVQRWLDALAAGDPAASASPEPKGSEQHAQQTLGKVVARARDGLDPNQD
jgi:predicted DNA-binding transcriptional regulator AlpA